MATTECDENKSFVSRISFASFRFLFAVRLCVFFCSFSYIFVKRFSLTVTKWQKNEKVFSVKWTIDKKSFATSENKWTKCKYKLKMGTHWIEMAFAVCAPSLSAPIEWRELNALVLLTPKNCDEWKVFRQLPALLFSSIASEQESEQKVGYAMRKIFATDATSQTNGKYLMFASFVMLSNDVTIFAYLFIFCSFYILHLQNQSNNWRWNTQKSTIDSWRQ